MAFSDGFEIGDINGRCCDDRWIDEGGVILCVPVHIKLLTLLIGGVPAPMHVHKPDCG